jgi:hypothetical protein
VTDEQEVASINTTDARGILNSFIVRLAGARVALLAILHALIFSFCYPLAWLVRFEFDIAASYLNVVSGSLLWVVGIELAVGALFGFYRGWWRYVGINDVLRLAAGCTTMLGALLAVWYTAPWTHFPGLAGVSRAVLFINYAFSLLAIFGTRVLVRLMKDIFRFEVSGEIANVLIIGAGDAGEALAREIQHRPQLGLHVAAFVDDQRAKWRSHIRGIPVSGPIANIAQIADAKNATEALIAIPTASGRRMREIIRLIADAKIRFRTVPGLDQLVTGRVRATQLRPVNADDLVRRKEIVLPGDRVGHLFRGKRIVVTGAGGSIGSELALQILRWSPISCTRSSARSWRSTSSAAASSKNESGRRTPFASISPTSPQLPRTSPLSVRTSWSTPPRTSMCHSASRMPASTSATTASPHAHSPRRARRREWNGWCSSRPTRRSSRRA